jgi:hypothetical protein
MFYGGEEQPGIHADRDLPAFGHPELDSQKQYGRHDCF